jgi:hypothetical protein
MTNYTGVAGGLGGFLQQQQYMPSMPVDTRSGRQQLADKRAANDHVIATLTEQNAEIDDALALLDQHPLIEKMQDLLRKLIGR